VEKKKKKKKKNCADHIALWFRSNSDKECPNGLHKLGQELGELLLIVSRVKHNVFADCRANPFQVPSLLRRLEMRKEKERFEAKVRYEKGEKDLRLVGGHMT